MMKKQICFTLLILAFWVAASAQDFKKAVAEARAEYEKLDRLHAVVRVQAYEDESAKTSYYYQEGDIKRDHLNYCYSFGMNDMLMNDNFLIVVDKDAKEISLGKVDQKKANQLMQDPIKSSFDSLSKYYEKPLYKGRIQNTDQYSIAPKKGYLTRLDISFNVETKLIQKILYHYEEGQLVAVEFLKMDTQPVFDKTIFNESRYVVFGKNGTPQAVGQFKGYHVSRVEN
jgi:hypothetical protein